MNYPCSITPLDSLTWFHYSILRSELNTFTRTPSPLLLFCLTLGVKLTSLLSTQLNLRTLPFSKHLSTQRRRSRFWALQITDLTCFARTFSAETVQTFLPCHLFVRSTSPSPVWTLLLTPLLITLHNVLLTSTRKLVSSEIFRAYFLQFLTILQYSNNRDLFSVDY